MPALVFWMIASAMENGYFSWFTIVLNGGVGGLPGVNPPGTIDPGWAAFPFGDRPVAKRLIHPVEYAICRLASLIQVVS